MTVIVDFASVVAVCLVSLVGSSLARWTKREIAITGREA
jgi:hypothetical protein